MGAWVGGGQVSGSLSSWGPARRPVNRSPSLSCCQGQREISGEPGQGRPPPSSPGCSPHSSRSPGRPRGRGETPSLGTPWWVLGPHLLLLGAGSRPRFLPCEQANPAQGLPEPGACPAGGSCAPGPWVQQSQRLAGITQGWPHGRSGGSALGLGEPFLPALRTGRKNEKHTRSEAASRPGHVAPWPCGPRAEVQAMGPTP